MVYKGKFSNDFRYNSTCTVTLIPLSVIPAYLFCMLLLTISVTSLIKDKKTKEEANLCYMMSLNLSCGHVFPVSYSKIFIFK